MFSMGQTKTDRTDDSSLKKNRDPGCNSFLDLPLEIFTLKRTWDLGC